MIDDVIRVTTKAATPAGRLWPIYDDEAGVLEIGSRVPADWPFGIDIDGTMVFDLDQSRRVANIDVHVGRRMWKTGLRWSWSGRAVPRDLILDEETVRRKSLSVGLEVRQSEDGRRIEIELGSGGQQGGAVALSDDCWAVLDGPILVGLCLFL